MASVFHSLDQILRIEEVGATPEPRFQLSRRGELDVDGTRVGHNTVVRRPEAAHRHAPRAGRSSHSRKRAGDLALGLKEVRIKHQLQLASPIRLGLLVLRLQEFRVGGEMRIGRLS